MADIKTTPVIVVQQPLAAKPAFQQQAFGPWVTNDPKIQKMTVRTNVANGIAQRKFRSTYPPAPTLAKTLTATSSGFEFAINVVGSNNVSGYNVYSSLTNNSNIAKLIRYVAQPPPVSALQSLTVQDVTAATPYYWISSVNSSGTESARVPVAGTAAPTPPPTTALPSGGSSGSGSAGGAAGGRGSGGRLLI